MVWEANIEASKEKYIFSFKNCYMLDYFKMRCFKICHGKNIFKKEKNTTWIDWRINKIRNMRLPLLTSMEMIRVVGPWVPDLPGRCPTKWQVPSSQAQGTTEVRPEVCMGSLMQSGNGEWTFSLGDRPPGDCPL